MPLRELPGKPSSVQFSYSAVSDSATPWTIACQASLSINNSQSLLYWHAAIHGVAMRSQCRWHRFDPQSWNQDPACPVAWHSQNKIKINLREEFFWSLPDLVPAHLPSFNSGLAYILTMGMAGDGTLCPPCPPLSPHLLGTSHYNRGNQLSREGISSPVRLLCALVLPSDFGDPQCLPFWGREGSLQEWGRPSPPLPPGGWAPWTLRVTRSHVTRGRRVLRAEAGVWPLAGSVPAPASVPHL